MPTHNEWLRTIEETEGNFRALYKRMKGDENLRRTKEHKLKDTQGNDMKRVVTVNMNDAATFGDKIISAINKAERHSVAESETKMSDEKTTKIENGVDLILATADKRIQRRGLPGLFPALNDQVCIRGRISARWLLKETEDGLVPDLLPMDVMQCSYEFGEDGLQWHQFWINKTKAQIKANYGIDYRGSNGRVRELWTPEESLYWLDDKPLTRSDKFKQIGGKHNYGEVPVVVCIAPVGSPMPGKDSEEFRGESIFWLDRLLYHEKDRAVSIMQTQNLTALRPPRQFLVDDPVTAEIPPESPYEMDTTVLVDKDGGYKEMPRLDMIQASRFAYSVIEAGMQRGALPALDYGNIGFPLSAVAIEDLSEKTSTVFVPRVDTLSLFYQMGVLMLFRMLKQQGGKLVLGVGRTKQHFTSSDFEGEYDLKFTWKSKDPVKNIANYSTGAAARGQVPLSTIIRDIHQADNPDEQYNLLKAEAAERERPLLRAYGQIQAFIALGQNDKAELLAQTEFRMTAQQVMAGQFAEAEPPPEETPGSQIPLLGPGAVGRQRSAKEASDLATTLAQE